MPETDELYQIINDKSKLDINMIHDYLSNRSYWAKGRSIETVIISIENSLCFGVYHANKQIGFARVVTDYAIFVWIMDVFILEEYRGFGLGIKLIDSIVNQENLSLVKRWGLGTEDAHGLYAKFGFTGLKKPANMMERTS